jgi:hypothetical protein
MISPKTPENDEHNCCTDDTPTNCFPMHISLKYTFYKDHSVECLEFSRSLEYCEENHGQAREQVNGITSFIDASNIYGSDDSTTDSLRTKSNGKLLVETLGTNDMLPKVKGVEISGDVRAREMPGLTTMHTLFMREHNRLCDLIANDRPGSSSLGR